MFSNSLLRKATPMRPPTGRLAAAATSSTLGMALREVPPSICPIGTPSRESSRRNQLSAAIRNETKRSEMILCQRRCLSGGGMGSRPRNFQPFSAKEEEDLVKVLTSKPRHVARRVRQLMLGSRKRIAQFRNTVTYLMIVLQGKLQKNDIDVSDAALVIEGIMKECVALHQSDMAHLLFRASLRFRKYGMKITIPCIRHLFDSYRGDDAKDLMRQLAEEMKGEPELRALAIAAYIYAGMPIEAKLLKESMKPGELSEEDYIAIIFGFGKLQSWDDIIKIVDEIIILDQKDTVSAGPIVSAAITALSSQPDVQLSAYKAALENVIPLTDRAVGNVARQRLRSAKSLMDVEEIEEKLKSELKLEKLGLSATTAVIAKYSDLVARGYASGDRVMLSKIEHLEAVIDAQIVNEEYDSVEPQYLLSLIKGYGVLGKIKEMSKVFDMVKGKGDIVDHRIYEEVIRWHAQAGNIKEVLAIKEEMEQENIFHTNYLYFNLFKALGKFYPRMVEKYYLELRGRLNHIDRQLYGQLLTTFTGLGDVEKVDALYTEMKAKALQGHDSIGPQASAVLLRAFSDNVEKCEEIIADAGRRGHLSHPRVQSAVVSFYASHKMNDKMQKFIASLPAKGTGVYIVQLNHYARTLNREKFEQTIEEMRESGLQFNDITYSTMITAYARWGDAERVRTVLAEAKTSQSLRDPKFFVVAAAAFLRLGDVDSMDEVWKELKAANLPASMEVYNRFLEMYMQRNNMERMQEVLQTMMVHIPPNPVTTTTIIDMLGKMGRIGEMEALFEEMSKSADVAPTLVTYHQAMNAYAKSGDVMKMEMMRSKMKDAGIAENHVTFNILAEGYGRAKRYEHLAELQLERKSKGIPMEEMGFMVLLSTYARARMSEEVNQTVREILDAKLELSSRLVGSIASAYSYVHDLPKVEHYVELLLDHPQRSARDVENVFLIYARLRDTSRLEHLLNRFPASEFIYNICISSFAKVGQYGKVAEVLQKMSDSEMALNVNTSIALSSLLLKAGKIELAQTVLKWKKTATRNDSRRTKEAQPMIAQEVEETEGMDEAGKLKE